MESLLNSVEAAAYLGISRRLLDKYKKDRKVAYIQIGRCIRYEKAALDQFYESMRVAADSPCFKSKS